MGTSMQGVAFGMWHCQRVVLCLSKNCPTEGRSIHFTDARPSVAGKGNIEARRCFAAFRQLMRTR